MQRTVECSIRVRVTVDETKFTEAFMAEFRRSFFPFDTIEEHIEHLGQLAARGEMRSDFIEGYGPPADMGIVVTDPMDDIEHWLVEDKA